MENIPPKKDSILQVSEKLFEKYSYRKVSIDEITQAAGVAKGTFYIYFKNKNELYSQILRNYYNEIVEPVKDFAENKPDLRSRLYEDFIVGLYFIKERKILQEILQKNSNYFSQSIDFDTFSKQNVEYIKILFSENINELRDDINLDELSEIYNMQMTLVFKEKDEDKFWLRAENLARIFIDGILSKQKWKTRDTNKIINNFKDNQ